MEENDCWKNSSLDSLTPIQSMVALRSRDFRTGKALRVTTGLLAGQTFRPSEMPRKTLQFWVELIPVFNDFATTMNNLVSEVRAVGPNCVQLLKAAVSRISFT